MAKRAKPKAEPRDGVRHARELISDACEVAGVPSLIDDARIELAQAGVIEAIQRQDDATLYDWLMDAASYQGVSNAVVHAYVAAHGNATFTEISASLDGSAACPKLTSWWHFEACGFRKAAFTCSQPQLIHRCPLPRFPLRNGGLNRTAYGLALFMRDICGGNFVRWVDDRLLAADRLSSPRRGQLLAESVIGPLRNVHGISDKVLNMAISMFLLAGDPSRERWTAAGASMIAVDTLVHGWMSRTGILRRLRSEHLYGPRCYAKDGCAEIIRRAARAIDCTRFNPNFPHVFPRYVQHAIWRFCAQSGHAQCNGFTVQNGVKCRNKSCELFAVCDRVVQPRADTAKR